jgi:hypothetical protein
MTARVQLQKKKSVVISLKKLGAKHKDFVCVAVVMIYRECKLVRLIIVCTYESSDQ